MSGESQQVDTEQDEVVSPEAAARAFQQGYDDDEDRATATPPAATPEPTAAPQPTPAPTPAPEFVQVTRQDWERVSASAAKVDSIEATLGKMPDQIFGTMGRTLDRRLAELQQATPQGAAVEISDEDFAEFKSEYPEIAELSRKGLNKVLAKLKGTGGQPVDMKAFDEKAAATRTEVIDMTLDTIVDGDWRAEVNTTRYQQWIAAQAADVQALADSKSLRDASRLMRLYRKHADAPATPAPPAATPAPTPAPTTAPAQPSMRSRQMAAAVAPRGEASAPAPQGKTPFQEGYDEEDV